MPDVTCQQLVELVTAYLDGALPAEEVEAIRTHLDTCDDCTAYVEQVEATVELAAALRDPASEEDVASLLERFRRR
jgi:anti-sigma factor RsiW